MKSNDDEKVFATAPQAHYPDGMDVFLFFSFVVASSEITPYDWVVENLHVPRFAGTAQMDTEKRN